MSASDLVQTQVGDLKRHLYDKKKLRALETSIGRFSEDEHLTGTGLFNSEGVSYYLVTNRGIHFSLELKTGFMKKEQAAQFISHSDISSYELVEVMGRAIGARLYDADGVQIAGFAFSDWPGLEDPLTRSRQLIQQLGFALT